MMGDPGYGSAMGSMPDKEGFNTGSGAGALPLGPARLGGAPADSNSNALTVSKRLPKEETM